MSIIPPESLPLKDIKQGSGTGRRGRLLRYHLTIVFVTAASAVIAAITAKLWPIHGLQIQASFFLSLASSCLTAFGLVFSLCLIGSQFMIARTNIVIKRIFGPGTWLYLGLFVITIFWTLAISYGAGDNPPSQRVCTDTFLFKHCISEAQAGRASIFGVAWSLLLLLPFILYIYRRLTVTFAFSSIVTAALRTRTARGFRNKCEHLTSEIIAVSADGASIEQGLTYLLELGCSAVRRSRKLRKSTAYSDAREITNQFCALNQALASYPPPCSRVIKVFLEWTEWVVLQSDQLNDKKYNAKVITRGHAGGIGRAALDIATYNLRGWQTSPDATICAQSSIGLMRATARACTSHEVRVRFSDAARELAKCAALKAVEGPEADFNLAIRSLIGLVGDLVAAGKTNLGGRMAFRSLTFLLEDLGEMGLNRKPIPYWVLRELHELTDALDKHHDLTKGIWARYLISLSRLQPDETISILAGSPDRHHGVYCKHSSWQSIVLDPITTVSEARIAIRAQSAAMDIWIKSDELSQMITRFEQLEFDYSSGAGQHTSVLLSALSDNIRSALVEDPIIKESYEQRKAVRRDSI